MEVNNKYNIGDTVFFINNELDESRITEIKGPFVIDDLIYTERGYSNRISKRVNYNLKEKDECPFTNNKKDILEERLKTKRETLAFIDKKVAEVKNKLFGKRVYEE